MSEQYIKDSLLEERAKLRKIIEICESFDFPTAIFNSQSKCVYSKNDLIKQDSDVKSVFKDDYFFEDLDFYTTIFIIKGVQYCAKVCRTDGYYVCGLFNSHTLGSMARYTDFAERLISSIDVIQANSSRLWEIMKNLRNQNMTKAAADMEVSLLKINRVFQSILEYLNMLMREPQPVMIDCFQLLSTVVKRTNKLLIDCGRYIDFNDQQKHYYIGADRRHSIVALVSAIQNSLMYSTRDCVPKINLTTITENKRNYVVFKIINDISYFAENHETLYEDDFSMNKFACGVPILKRYAEETGGEFILEKVDGMAITLLKIPEEKKHGENALFFECDEFTYFETGIPDFLELKIGEVVELFSNKI